MADVSLPALLLDGPAVAAHLGIDPATLRKWASRGLVRRCGRDDRGRTLYDVDEVIACSESRVTRSATTVTPDRST